MVGIRPCDKAGRVPADQQVLIGGWDESGYGENGIGDWRGKWVR